MQCAVVPTCWMRHEDFNSIILNLCSSSEFLLDRLCAQQISDKMGEVELVLAFVWIDQYADVPEINNTMQAESLRQGQKDGKLCT